MRLWWEIARRSYRRYRVYAWAAAAGVFTNSVFGFVRAYILLAVHRVRPTVGPFDVLDSLSYAFLTQGLIMAVGLFVLVGIGERVRTGDIVTDLYRPVDFQGYHLASDLGRAGYHFLYRGIPPVLVGAVAFGMRLPPDVGIALAAALSLVLAVLVGFGVRFLVDMVSFWLLDSVGAQNIHIAITVFCGGLAVPLSFLPDGVEGVVRLLPWAQMIQHPVEVFLGDRQGGDLVGLLALQAGWVLVLLAAGRLVLSAATRKVVIQGG